MSSLLLAGTEVNHAKAYGRIAFAVPKAQQEYIRQKIIDSKSKILTDLISLDTPGKATVRVIILADPVSFTNILFFFLIMTTLLFY